MPFVTKCYTPEEDEIIVKSDNDLVTSFMLNRTPNAIIKRKRRLQAIGYKTAKQVEYSHNGALLIAMQRNAERMKRFTKKRLPLTTDLLFETPKYKDNRRNSFYSFHVYTEIEDKMIMSLPAANMIKLIFPYLTLLGINARKMRLREIAGENVVPYINWREPRARQELIKMGWKPGYMPVVKRNKIRFSKPTYEFKNSLALI